MTFLQALRIAGWILVLGLAYGALIYLMLNAMRVGKGQQEEDNKDDTRAE